MGCGKNCLFIARGLLEGKENCHCKTASGTPIPPPRVPLFEMNNVQRRSVENLIFNDVGGGGELPFFRRRPPHGIHCQGKAGGRLEEGRSKVWGKAGAKLRKGRSKVRGRAGARREHGWGKGRSKFGARRE